MSRWLYVRFIVRYLELLVRRRGTLGRTVARMARLRGDAVFCRCGEQELTFAEFNPAANHRANALRASGVEKGQVVALLMNNRPEFLLTLTALAKLGAVTAMLNTGLRGRALEHSLRISLAVRVVVDEDNLPTLMAALPQVENLSAEEVYVDRPGAGPALPPGVQTLQSILRLTNDGEPPEVPLTSQDVLCYVYTSGTTGLPKAARVTHYRWVAAGLGMGMYGMELTGADTIYCPLPLYHSNASVIAFGSAMVNGCRLAITPRFSVGAFWGEVRQHAATRIVYIGEILRYLVNAPAQAEERGHRVSIILGNGLRPDIWQTVVERFGISNIREFYASTEGNAITLNINGAPGSVGKAILRTSDNTLLVRYDVETGEYAKDARGLHQRCAPGEAGELLGQVKFTTPFHGYTNPEDTAKKLLRGVKRAGDLWFRTGDLLKQDADGNYYFVDRIGDTYRWKGENVSTQEVQEILTAHPGIAHAIVYGVQVPGADGRAGMAALELEPGAHLDPDALYRYVCEALAPFARPVFLRHVAHIEVTGTYKYRKVTLQEEGFDLTRVHDPLYVLDTEAGTYHPLTPKLHPHIVQGNLRF